MFLDSLFAAMKRNMNQQNEGADVLSFGYFQMMRFFLVEHESFVHMSRSFPLEIFPRVTCAYSRLFQLALGELERAFVLGGEQGLDLAR
ncbi:hypothetical protein Brms1b_013269 [Colletotrichum noveboracense]|nr:hypothetical protein Brms1b_013269 [Colletotrichum noveboracense]